MRYPVAALLVPLLVSPMAWAAPADVIIAGGTVYTGADAPPATADVVIAGDKIVYVGPDAARRFEARQTFAAKGKIVAPGFIDGHAHPDTYLHSADAAQRTAPPWLFQGATTLIVGVDGNGTPDISDMAASYGTNGIGPNVAPYVGFGTIRQRVLKFDDRDPTPAELDQERALAARGMCQGAIGLSSGLFYSPQSYAKTEEVIAVAREAAKRGGIYDTHQRDESSYSIGLLASVAETLRIGREAGLPVHFSHIKAAGVDVEGKAPEVIAAINAARAQGMEVTANQYTWTAASTGISAALMPRWAEAGGREAILKRFEDPTQLAKIRTEARDNLRRRGGPESLLLIASNQEWTGKTLAQMAAIWMVEPVDAAIRVIKSSANGGSIASFNMIESDVQAFMRQPWLVTSTDGGANHPRTSATYPRKFQKYVKEDKVISVLEFIRSSTGRAADIYRLDRRGYLREGYFADVIVFDPDTYNSKADYVHPMVLAEGMQAVFINGKAAIADGKATGALAGRVLLRTPPAGTCP